MARFCRYELRTTDLARARAFYATILGEAAVEVVPLPEAAAARGAPAHWLGHLGVDDVETAATAFEERGATRLGPTRLAGDGGQVAIVRDPGGAVVALATPPRSARASPLVVWHLLHTVELARATASYCELFGWKLTGRLDLATAGVYHSFAWQQGGPNVGSMTDISGRQGVHPHWLFHFRIEELEPALVEVRAAGGIVVSEMALPDGDRLAVCDDPQGAAFALREERRQHVGVGVRRA